MSYSTRERGLPTVSRTTYDLWRTADDKCIDTFTGSVWGNIETLFETVAGEKWLLISNSREEAELSA